MTGRSQTFGSSPATSYTIDAAGNLVNAAGQTVIPPAEQIVYPDSYGVQTVFTPRNGLLLAAAAGLAFWLWTRRKRKK